MIKKLRSTCSDQSGFTLIELIVAVAISSLIMLMIYSAHKTVMSSIRDLAGIAEFHENINLTIRHMDRDISCIIVNPDNKQIKFKGENDKGGTLAGGKLNFVTVNRHSFSVLGDVESESNQTDVKAVRYYLKKDPQYQGLFFLMRSEKNLYDTKTEDGNNDTVAPETESLVLENIVDLKFEFIGDGNWDDKWSNDNPPKAIRTTLILRNYRGKEESFIFISNILMTKKS